MKETTGFEFIQEIGGMGIEFESTQGWTLTFDEAKSLALLILKKAQELNSDELKTLIEEVESAKMWDKNK